jgi:hypothetical protein
MSSILNLINGANFTEVTNTNPAMTIKEMTELYSHQPSYLDYLPTITIIGLGTASICLLFKAIKSK